MNETERWEGNRPYAYPGNVLSILERFRNLNLPQSLPQHALITAGVPEGNVGRTVFALQFLGLINESNEPTETWRSLADATADEFGEMLGRIVRSAYADVLEYVDPATDSVARVESAFQRFNPKSQRKRMATLMLGLFDAAGLPVKDPPKRRPTKSEGLGTGERPSRGRHPKPVTLGGQLDMPGQPIAEKKVEAPAQKPEPAKAQELPAGLHAALVSVLDGIPKGEPRWTVAEKQRFITAFQAILELFYPAQSEEELKND